MNGIRGFEHLPRAAQQAAYNCYAQKVLGRVWVAFLVTAVPTAHFVKKCLLIQENNEAALGPIQGAALSGIIAGNVGVWMVTEFSLYLHDNDRDFLVVNQFKASVISAIGIIALGAFVEKF